MFTTDDYALVIHLAACSLAKTPQDDNWVDEVGGLPDYICRIARAVSRGGKSVSSSIAIAVGRIKVWASGGGDVNADTRAKAAKALAEWEAKKKAAKLDNKVKFSNVISLSYNLDHIRSAYTSQYSHEPHVYRYVRELWSDYLIVAIEDEKSLSPLRFLKVAYSVGKDNSITFGEEVEVKQAFVALSQASTDLTDAQLERAGLIPCTVKANRSLVETVRLSQKLKIEEQELMALSATVRQLI